ncbi:MAG: IS5 family transposase [Oleiphilus sp.]|nr:MAG: IS5 family transposase [Oleiphilus sp.]
MIRTQSSRQLSLAEFDWPFQAALDEQNRWVKMSECIPWDALAEAYYKGLSSMQGRPTKDARLVVGAVIIKHKLCLSDRETVAQIQENPYLQFFVGLPGYQMEAPFAPSLFVEIRKRMGPSVFDVFYDAVIAAVESKRSKQKPAAKNKEKADKTDDEDNTPPGLSDSDPEPVKAEPEHKGKLILDATVAPQAIRFPTDLGLLNEAREFSERIIDKLFENTGLKNKPRTYRQKARKAYLAIVKKKRPGAKLIRKGIKQQWQYLRRNLVHIKQLLQHFPEATSLPLPHWLLHRYWVIQHVYEQQREMYRNKVNRCDDRIVSISQPYVRPIMRGKVDKPTEFGAKLSVSLTGDGVARVDHLRWDAFHEGLDLPSQVETYRNHHGHYPEVVLGDTIYGSRDNRKYLKDRGIRFAGKPLGRPKKITEENQEALKHEAAKRREEYLQRIPIEGKFGQGKNGYNLNYIRAKRSDTSLAWINSIFLVMNLLILLKIFCWFWKKVSTGMDDWLKFIISRYSGGLWVREFQQ